MYPDLRFHYGIDLVDVIEGRGPHPRLVLSMIQRLPGDSLTAALMQGGVEHFGFDRMLHVLTDIYDAINSNTRATGFWDKGKAPDIPPGYRPATKAPEPAQSKPKVTVASLFKRMTGGK